MYYAGIDYHSVAGMVAGFLRGKPTPNRRTWVSRRDAGTRGRRVGHEASLRLLFSAPPRRRASDIELSAEVAFLPDLPAGTRKAINALIPAEGRVEFRGPL